MPYIPHYFVRTLGPTGAQRYAVTDREGQFYDAVNNKWLVEDLDRSYPEGASLYYRSGEAALICQNLEEAYHRANNACHHMQAIFDIRVYGDSVDMGEVVNFLHENFGMSLNQDEQPGPNGDYMAVHIHWDTLQIKGCTAPTEDIEIDLDS